MAEILRNCPSAAPQSAAVFRDHSFINIDGFRGNLIGIVPAKPAQFAGRKTVGGTAGERGNCGIMGRVTNVGGLTMIRNQSACFLTAVLLVATFCRSAVALIVVPPATNNNIAAPVDDPGWLNVGDNGIYLGNRWVITAAHVGAQTTTFPGVGTFTVVPGSAVQLLNPTGQNLSANTDLLMYRLTTDPGLPSLAISASTPAIRETVMFIGDGRSVMPDAMETRWDASWTKVGSGGVLSGYESGTGR